MNTTKQSIELLYPQDFVPMMKNIEYAYRICYKNEGKQTDDSYVEFIPKHIKHESPLEHSSISVLLVCNRAIQQEITRHRHTAFSIESTRWINYFKKMGGEITFIEPNDPDMSPLVLAKILDSYENCERTYNELIQLGVKPERARDVLPLGLKGDIVMSGSVRTWRNVFNQRVFNPHAHKDIRELMTMTLDLFKEKAFPLFGDLS